MGLRVANTWNGSGSECVCVADGDAPLLHRLKERGLRLRRGAVDLVGQDQVVEDRARQEAHATTDVAPRVLLFVQHVGPGDVGGQQIGRELHAAERQVERLGQRGHEQRLGEPRDPDEQRVPAREQRHEHQLDDPPCPTTRTPIASRSARLGVPRHLEELRVALGSRRLARSWGRRSC